MRPPAYWNNPAGARHWQSILLSPLSYLYGYIVQRKLKQAKPYKASIPVICVGNVTMGGVGKTPFALMLSKLLKEQGYQPGFLTRGYGGSEIGPLLVTEQHSAADIGDEPLLLKREGPVCVSRDRASGARLLEETDCDIIIMDDGFQNPSLHKDYSYLLIDKEVGYGNGQVFPAGPLRERPAEAERRADMIVTVDPTLLPDKDQKNFVANKASQTAFLKPVSLPTQKRYIAFCGIGRPRKFFDGLRISKVNIHAVKSFPDHHVFSDEEIKNLKDMAQEAEATLITTEKDYVRLSPAQKEGIETFPVHMYVNDPAGLLSHLKSALGKD